MAHPTKHRTDRRIQRTRQSLRAALLGLIKEKGFDAISIEEITDRANVGRATFYLHYKDKEDLLLEEFSEMANEKTQVLSEIPFSAWLQPQANTATAKKEHPTSPLEIVFEHIYENSELYYILLKSERSGRIVERIRRIATEAIVKFVETKAQTDPIPFLFKVPVEFFAAFFSGAMLSTVEWWLEEKMRHTPKEIANLFMGLFVQGATKAVGPLTYTANTPKRSPRQTSRK